MAGVTPDNAIPVEFDEEGYAHFISRKSFLHSTAEERFTVAFHNKYLQHMKKLEEEKT